MSTSSLGNSHIASFKGEYIKINIKFQVQSGFAVHRRCMAICACVFSHLHWGRPRGKSCMPCKDDFAHHLLSDKTYLLHSIVSTLNIRN